jgi:hypothetical protein
MNPIGPTLHGSMDQQASYVIQSFALARAAGAERMSIYKLVDESHESGGELYGLVRNDGSVRPAFSAYQTAVRYMSSPTSAVYTWDGASEPPTDDQISQLIQSNANRTQWIWPAAVNRITMERGAERVTIAWNASPKLVTGRIPAVTKSAQVIDKFGRDTGEVVARDGQYQLELYPTNNNTDPRDPTAYLVGGEPRLIVERVTPLPTTVDALIQVVWPKDPRTANITALLLMPGSTQPVPCRWTPTVRLLSSIDGGPSTRLTNGAKRMVAASGLNYAVWDFNNIDISAALQGRSIDFWLDVDGVATRATRVTYTNATPTPTPTPTPALEPDTEATPLPTETPVPTPTPVEAHSSCGI